MPFMFAFAAYRSPYHIDSWKEVASDVVTHVMLTPVGNASPSPVYRLHESRFRKVEEAVADDVAKLCTWWRCAR